MDDEPFYEQVSKELEAGRIRRGLMTKALSQAGGDERAAHALYIRFRADQLKDEARQSEAARKLGRRAETAKIRARHLAGGALMIGGLVALIAAPIANSSIYSPILFLTAVGAAVAGWRVFGDY